MRLQAPNPIKLRSKLLGGEKPLICVPLASVDEVSILTEIDEVINMKPDVIEWRADYFESILDVSKVKNILEIIRSKNESIPIIFTCRSHDEGGYRNIDDETRLKLFTDVVDTGFIDVMDVELAFGNERIEKIKSLAIQKDVKLILSYHSFTDTPSENFIVEKIKEQIKNGADISKIAVMPKDQGDVLKLLNATYRARKEISNPIIGISMGPIGSITRLTAFVFGSDMTFAAGVNASAPGQLPIEVMRKYIDTII
ncbi:type I 3-dehydroquinate dehydratase [Lutispora thermophila]|uniref:3-dehydroquinate dehydratase n=1 Tax=Lutispora thermophila DSM 19022 TaxID=1122184 RepID=A0A1M6DJD7_9FIRM|nr:type I 3-dehydroquinate dehydratase [Lutispora thermophila]SHI73325.1 3-dehydroquinate dehydratase [Lutispora thermophila DSM 19022]